MTMNPLPPQAYTKETMVKAYQWLQIQNDSIKEMATTPDILISLYLKAKLNGESALERPSIQNFKNELRNLAGMMNDFEGSENPNLPQPPSLPQTPPPAVMSQANPTPSIPATTQSHQMTYSSHVTQHQPVAPSPQPQNHNSLELDSRSLAMIREVKNEMNLGSDMEALRLIISVGHKRLKSLT